MSLTYRPVQVFDADGTRPVLERELVEVRQALARSTIVGVPGEAEYFRVREAATLRRLELLACLP